jgi:hypothetical protein
MNVCPRIDKSVGADKVDVFLKSPAMIPRPAALRYDAPMES